MTKDKILDISFVLEHSDPKEIRSLDIEGAPNGIKQFSVVDANLNNIFNCYFASGDDIKGQKRITIAKAVKNAKVLIGFNIASDLMALQKFNFKLKEHTVVIDLYRTFLFRINNGLESSNKLVQGLSLKDVAAYYGIQNKKGWHNSFVDAKVTMQLFQAMQTVTGNRFWVIDTGKSQNKESSFGQKESESDGIMTVQDMDLFNYAQNKTVPIVKIGKHLYQGVFVINGIKVVARMTSNERKLYKKICEMTPNYPLQIFYLTVLAPGAVQHREKDLSENSVGKDLESSKETEPVLTDTLDKEPQKDDAEDIESPVIENAVLEK